MKVSKTKTLEDFPKLLVAAVLRIGTSEDGYTRFEIEGSFDRVIKNISRIGFGFYLPSGGACAQV
jgi:hypothetical protein